MARSVLAISILLAIAAIIGLNSVYIVSQREQAIVLRLGEFNRAVNTVQEEDPGLKFKIPLIENVTYYDRRIMNMDPDGSEVLLRGQERLVVDAFARYRISDPRLFFTSVRTIGLAEDRLETFMDNALRNVLGRATQADVLFQRRDELAEEITRDVLDDAAGLGMEIIDVRIRAADLPQQIQVNVFRRMITDRQQAAAQIRAEGEEQAGRIQAEADAAVTVLLAEAERKAQSLRGQGDQQAIRTYADAFERDPEFYAFYRSLEAYRQSLSSGDTTLVLDPSSDFFSFFGNVDGGGSQP